MHFLMSIIYLLLAILLTIGYPVCLYYLIAGGLYYRRRKISRNYGPYSEKAEKCKLWPLRPPRWFVRALMIIPLVLISLYVHQRVEWIGEENTHLKAKEYWVAGQVVAGMRFAAMRVLHPDNPILVPLNGLQRVIYKHGVRYLPDGDGEAGVWTDFWFLCPYGRKLTLPYFVYPKGKYPSPKMRRMLDECWWALKTMTARPIADQQMRVELYYRNFPRLALYFDTYDGFYADRYIGSADVLLKRPEHVDKLERLLRWLSQLKVKWKEDAYEATIWNKYPIVEAFRCTVRLSTLQNLMSAISFRGEFRCDHPYVEALNGAMQNVMSDDYASNALLNYSLRRHGQAEILYKEHVYSMRGEFCRYVLTQICDRRFPEEHFLLVSEHDLRSRWSQRGVEYGFREEFKCIKEISNCL